MVPTDWTNELWNKVLHFTKNQLEKYNFIDKVDTETQRIELSSDYTVLNYTNYICIRKSYRKRKNGSFARAVQFTYDGICDPPILVGYLRRTYMIKDNLGTFNIKGFVETLQNDWLPKIGAGISKRDSKEISDQAKHLCSETIKSLINECLSDNWGKAEFYTLPYTSRKLIGNIKTRLKNKPNTTVTIRPNTSAKYTLLQIEGLTIKDAIIAMAAIGKTFDKK